MGSEAEMVPIIAGAPSQMRAPQGSAAAAAPVPGTAPAGTRCVLSSRSENCTDPPAAGGADAGGCGPTTRADAAVFALYMKCLLLLPPRVQTGQLAQGSSLPAPSWVVPTRH